MLLLEMLFLQRFFTVNKFSENKTVIPIFFFLLLMNAGHFFDVLTPAHFTLLFLTFLILFNTRDNSERPMKNRMFTSGILIGVASLIDVNILWIILFLIFSLIATRYSSVKEVIILFVGLLFSYIYVFTAFFLSDNLPVLQDSLRHLSLFGVVREAKTIQILDWITVGYMILSLSGIMMVLKLYYDNKLIALRKRYMTTVFLCIILLISVVFCDCGLPQGLIYQIAPITLFYSMLCNIKKRLVLHDILIVAMLVLLWL